MYRQMAYPEKVDELRHVIPARKYISHKVTKQASPFLPYTVRDRFFQASAKAFLSVIERVLGRMIYVENEHRELILLEPRARALLTRLIEEGIVRTWSRLPLAPDAPYLAGVTIDIAPIKLPDGRVRHMGGSTGNGTGKTLEEAMIPALGELLERYAVTRWDEQTFVRGTYGELMQRGAVDSQSFVQYSKKQLADPDFRRSIVDDETEMNWVAAHSLIDNKKVLVPGQLTYIMYEHAFPHEPVFQTTSSSAAAAGGSLAHAAYGAICEAIERDSFLLFWLNRLSPPRIDPETIPVEEMTDLIKAAEALGVKIEILDCTTDLAVPTFLSVCIDPNSNHAIAVNAVTDFDVRASLKKLARETLKQLHTNWPAAEGVVEPHAIKDIDDRQRYWSQSGMAQKGKFLLEGKEISFDEVKQPPIPKNYDEALKVLRHIFSDAGYHCYLVDVKAEQVRRAGLRVVRAIIPELVPIYFNEGRRHAGTKRLYTVPATLGYTNGARNEDELNDTPHPFL